MTESFEPPPKKLSILATVGGVITAVAAIAGLEYWSNHLSKPNPQVSNPSPATQTSVAQLDAKSMVIPGQPLPAGELTAKVPYIAPKAGELTPQELAMARHAWGYFQRNWNNSTGLVNSVDGFASVTLWDQAAAIAGLVSAKELGIVPAAEFESKMSQSLKTLAKLPLYKGELPNKVYNPKTLIPVNYGQLDKREEIGWSAIDLGRLALWLKIVGSKYPQFKDETEAVWKSWKVARLTKTGKCMELPSSRKKNNTTKKGA